MRRAAGRTLIAPRAHNVKMAEPPHAGSNSDAPECSGGLRLQLLADSPQLIEALGLMRWRMGAPSRTGFRRMVDRNDGQRGGQGGVAGHLCGRRYEGRRTGWGRSGEVRHPGEAGSQSVDHRHDRPPRSPVQRNRPSPRRSGRVIRSRCRPQKAMGGDGVGDWLLHTLRVLINRTGRPRRSSCGGRAHPSALKQPRHRQRTHRAQHRRASASSRRAQVAEPGSSSQSARIDPRPPALPARSATSALSMTSGPRRASS
jgi:hypothetical protein